MVIVLRRGSSGNTAPLVLIESYGSYKEFLICYSGVVYCGILRCSIVTGIYKQLNQVPE